MDDCLVGVRLRATAQADDYRVGDLELHVGDLVLVETAAESAVGEVRRPKREIPEMKKDRAYPRVLRLAAEGLSTAGAAARLHLSEGTVRNYLSSAIGKTHSRNRIEAVQAARTNGWL